MFEKKLSIFYDSSSPAERRGFLKKLGGVVAGVTALGGFTYLKSKNTYSGRELYTAFDSEPFLSAISMFAGSFAPRNWAFCDGQEIHERGHEHLFSLLGRVFGGDKHRKTFNLPDMRGRVPIHFGTGPALTERKIGQRGGKPVITLTADMLPRHHHTLSSQDQLNCFSQEFKAKAYIGRGALNENPYNRVLGQPTIDNKVYASSGNKVTMDDSAIRILDTTDGSAVVENTGGNGMFQSNQPTICVSFIIALRGIFPPRS